MKIVEPPFYVAMFLATALATGCAAPSDGGPGDSTQSAESVTAPPLQAGGKSDEDLSGLEKYSVCLQNLIEQGTTAEQQIYIAEFRGSVRGTLPVMVTHFDGVGRMWLVLGNELSGWKLEDLSRAESDFIGPPTYYFQLAYDVDGDGSKETNYYLALRHPGVTTSERPSEGRTYTLLTGDNLERTQEFDPANLGDIHVTPDGEIRRNTMLAVQAMSETYMDAYHKHARAIGWESSDVPPAPQKADYLAAMDSCESIDDPLLQEVIGFETATFDELPEVTAAQ